MRLLPAVVAVLAIGLAGCAGRGAGSAGVAAPTPRSRADATTRPPAAALPPTTTAPVTTTMPVATPVPAPPAGPGTYPLVAATVSLVDATRPTVSHGRTVATTRTLTTMVWRPASGRWPLIVFAHGYQVGPAPYIPLLQAWASAGFVVAAPEFPLTDEAVAGAALDENDIQNQPWDMRFVLDALVAPGSTESTYVDPTRVLFAGHSDGAESALAGSLVPAPPGAPALRGVVCMSVAPLLDVTHTANPPILVTQGDADTTNPPARAHLAWVEAAGPKYYLDLLGGGHLPPLLPGSRWLATVEATTLAFFRLVTAGGGGPAARLAAGAVMAAGTVPGVATITAG